MTARLLVAFVVVLTIAACLSPTPRSAAVAPSFPVSEHQPSSGAPETSGVVPTAPASGAPPAQPSPMPSSTPRPAATAGPRLMGTLPKVGMAAPFHVKQIRATWYCGHGSPCTRGHPAGGMFAAISPDLASLTGHLVRVRAGGRSVVVRIIDCNCATTRGIDLYAAAFARLAPLSAGVLTVTVEGVR